MPFRILLGRIVERNSLGVLKNDSIRCSASFLKNMFEASVSP
jgi:hypothetical protein